MLPRRLSCAKLAPLLRTSPSVALACLSCGIPLDLGGAFIVRASLPAEFNSEADDDDDAFDLASLQDLAVRERFGLPPPTPKTPKLPPPTPRPALHGSLDLIRFPARAKFPLLNAGEMMLLLSVLKARLGSPSASLSLNRGLVFATVELPAPAPALELQPADADAGTAIAFVATLDLLGLPLPPFPASTPLPLLLLQAGADHRMDSGLNLEDGDRGIDLAAPWQSLAADLSASLLHAAVGPLLALRISGPSSGPAAAAAALEERWGLELAPERLFQRVRPSARRLELCGPPSLLSVLAAAGPALRHACLRLSCLDYPAIAHFLRAHPGLVEFQLHLTTAPAPAALPSGSPPPPTPNLHRPLLWDALRSLPSLTNATLPWEAGGSHPHPDSRDAPYPALPALTRLALTGGLPSAAEGVRPAPSMDTPARSRAELFKDAADVAADVRGRDGWWDAALQFPAFPKLQALELRGARGPRGGIAELSALRSLAFVDHAFTARSFCRLALGELQLTALRIDRFVAAAPSHVTFLLQMTFGPVRATLQMLDLALTCPADSVLDLRGFTALHTLLLRRAPGAGAHRGTALPRLANVPESLRKLRVQCTSCSLGAGAGTGDRSEWESTNGGLWLEGSAAAAGSVPSAESAAAVPAAQLFGAEGPPRWITEFTVVP